MRWVSMLKGNRKLRRKRKRSEREKECFLEYGIGTLFVLGLVEVRAGVCSDSLVYSLASERF